MHEQDKSCNAAAINRIDTKLDELLIRRKAERILATIDCRNHICNANREGMYSKCAELEEQLEESQRREQEAVRCIHDIEIYLEFGAAPKLIETIKNRKRGSQDAERREN